jgi:prepilin-type N-terminal cleavage/methylation domain-containing protein
MIRPKRPTQSGFTLVETAIAMAILTLVMYTFVGSFVNQAHSQLRSQLLLQAADYAREGLEVVYNLSSNTNTKENWVATISDMADGSSYYPEFDDSAYKVSLKSGSQTINGFFSREITFSKVYRNSHTGDIETSGAVDDHVIEVKSKVTIIHSQANTSISITSYLINPHSI